MKRFLEATAIMIALSAGSAEAAQVKRVTFESQGQTLVGHLYLPDDYQAGQKLPGVVVTGSWTSVKEQMSGTYAEELADRGYASLAFDFRGWGESKDSVMFLEDPKRKKEDVIAAANFLTQRPEINSGKVAGLGICASAGYIADAALASDTLQSTRNVHHNRQNVKPKQRHRDKPSQKLAPWVEACSDQASPTVKG
ncbi:MAG: CocE/NonD family hydrolase [Cyanobacteria bacterium P01_A01_bin.17]